MERSSTFPRFISVILTSLLALGTLGAVAEDGTSGTVPESLHQCEIVTANYIPSSAETPVASPAATPVATPAATPVSETAEEPDVLTEDLDAATRAILECMSSKSLDELLQITSAEFRASWIGMGSTVSDEDFGILLPMIASLPYSLVGIDNATADGENATATVRYTIGRQLVTSEWSYGLVSVNGERVWQVQNDNKVRSVAPEGASQLQIVINDGSFAINSETVPSGDIVIDVTNVGEVPHEVLIVRVPAGTEASDFASATNGIPPGGTFVGQLTLPPGTQGNMVLTNVRAGTYTIVDLLPNESGVPNVSDGMITELTVE